MLIWCPNPTDRALDLVPTLSGQGVLETLRLEFRKRTLDDLHEHLQDAELILRMERDTAETQRQRETIFINIKKLVAAQGLVREIQRGLDAAHAAKMKGRIQ